MADLHPRKGAAVQRGRGGRCSLDGPVADIDDIVEAGLETCAIPAFRIQQIGLARLLRDQIFDLRQSFVGPSCPAKQVGAGFDDAIAIVAAGIKLIEQFQRLVRAPRYSEGVGQHRRVLRGRFQFERHAMIGDFLFGIVQRAIGAAAFQIEVRIRFQFDGLVVIADSPAIIGHARTEPRAIAPGLGIVVTAIDRALIHRLDRLQQLALVLRGILPDAQRIGGCGQRRGRIDHGSHLALFLPDQVRRQFPARRLDLFYDGDLRSRPADGAGKMAPGIGGVGIAHTGHFERLVIARQHVADGRYGIFRPAQFHRYVLPRRAGPIGAEFQIGAFQLVQLAAQPGSLLPPSARHHALEGDRGRRGGGIECHIPIGQIDFPRHLLGKGFDRVVDLIGRHAFICRAQLIGEGAGEPDIGADDGGHLHPGALIDDQIDDGCRFRGHARVERHQPRAICAQREHGSKWRGVGKVFKARAGARTVEPIAFAIDDRAYQHVIERAGHGKQLAGRIAHLRVDQHRLGFHA